MSSTRISLPAMELDEIFTPEDRDTPAPVDWGDAFEM
jgi:hypothetical protein